MSTLTVTDFTDYSHTKLAGVDHITYADGPHPIYATFSAGQFNGSSISNSVVITGNNSGANALLVSVAGNSVFTAAGWTFQHWGSTALVQFQSMVGHANVTGSSVADWFVSGPSTTGHDSLFGGGGADLFNMFGTLAGSVINGGEGLDTVRLSMTSDTSVNLAKLNMTSVERVEFNSANLEVSVDHAQFGAGGISGVQMNDVSGVLIVFGGSVSLENLNVVQAHPGDLSVRIYGTPLASNQLTGSALSDLITGGQLDDTVMGGKGADTMSGGDGNDTFLYLASDVSDTGEVVSGGNGTDTILVGSGARLELGLLQLSGVEALGFDAGGGTVSVAAETVAGSIRGISSITGGGGADHIIFHSSDQFVPTPSQSFNFSTIALNNWTSGQDDFTIYADLQGIAGYVGTAGDDVFVATSGGGSLEGGLGNDTYTGVRIGVSYGIIEMAGGGEDTVEAPVSLALGSGSSIEILRCVDPQGRQAMDLTGNEIKQSVVGNAGENHLDGKAGSDRITGGAGQDHFVFTTAFSKQNVDTITDFSVADDTIDVDSSLVGLPDGTLSAGQFKVNGSGKATTHDVRIIYDKDSGNLYFDADGDGAISRVKFAELSPDLHLTYQDFMII